MSYYGWLAENTQYYKGYTITPSCISSDGIVRWTTANEMGATMEDVLENAVRIIEDAKLAEINLGESE